MSADVSAGTEPVASPIRITGGSPTPEEIAAATAVLEAALEELAGEHRRRAAHGPSDWQRSQRGVRAPLTPGTWGTFGR